MKISNEDFELLKEITTEKIGIENYFKMKKLIDELEKQKEKMEIEEQELQELLEQLKDCKKPIIKDIIKKYKEYKSITYKQVQVLKNELVWVDYKERYN